MNGLIADLIVIDTNVFKHLIDRDVKFNPDGHIAVLLSRLAGDSIQLCVDAAGKISKDYKSILFPMFESKSEIGVELGLLRYWMQLERRIEVEIDRRGLLMTNIKKVIIESGEHADRYFVAVAFERGRPLVTNDETHILIGPPHHETKLGPRQSRLMRETRKQRAPGGEILTSREAHGRL
jgi:hypothetical protein